VPILQEDLGEIARGQAILLAERFAAGKDAAAAATAALSSVAVPCAKRKQCIDHHAENERDQGSTSRHGGKAARVG